MAKLVEIDIHDLATDGKSVGLLNGKVVFLNGGLPGERVLAEIIREKPRFNRAIVREIIKRSEARRDAPCQHFSICGGCTWQDLVYEEQLKLKQRQVVDCMTRIGHFEDTIVEPIIPCREQFFYRNKMEFSFHTAENDNFVLGLHHQGKFDQIFDIEKCHLESEISNQIIAFVREFVKKHNIPVYDVKLHHGLLRFLVIREGKNSDQIMVNIVTSYGSLPEQDSFVSGLIDRFPTIATIVHNQNGQKSNIASGEIETVLYGPGYIEEIILGKRFRIRANSFFQTNSRQAENLYKIALDWLDPEPSDSLLDLYCGTGTIGILASEKVGKVTGLELVPDAITAAIENASLNNCDNVQFMQGNVRALLRENMEQFSEYSIIVLDPPRAGVHPRVIKRIEMLAPPKLLYISCNPATFARDAEELVKSGYELPTIKPVDMFPHTRHIELVALFTRK